MQVARLVGSIHALKLWYNDGVAEPSTGVTDTLLGVAIHPRELLVTECLLRCISWCCSANCIMWWCIYWVVRHTTVYIISNDRVHFYLRMSTVSGSYDIWNKSGNTFRGRESYRERFCYCFCLNNYTKPHGLQLPIYLYIYISQYVH